MERGTLNSERQMGLHYNKLNTPVRAYVDNLRAQVYEVFRKYDVANMTEFIAKTHFIEVNDRQKVIKLMEDMVAVYQKNEVPGGIIETAREILGRDNVHGVEDVEFALGYKLDRSEIPTIPYTLEDLEKSKEIKEKTGVEEMLVLFVADKDGEPLTGERMNELLQKKYTEMGLGKFLRDHDTFWYRNIENFFQKDGLNYSWKLITKQIIPDSKNRHHDWQPGDNWNYEDSQEYAIEQFIDHTEVPKKKFNRPDPFEMLYAVAVHLIATERENKGKGERLLNYEYHWSNVRSFNNHFVGVGCADERGARVRFSFTIAWDLDVGVCLSRDPS